MFINTVDLRANIITPTPIQ